MKRLLKSEEELNSLVKELDQDWQEFYHLKPDFYPCVAVVQRDIDHSDGRPDFITFTYVYESDFN